MTRIPRKQLSFNSNRSESRVNDECACHFRRAARTMPTIILDWQQSLRERLSPFPPNSFLSPRNPPVPSKSYSANFPACNPPSMQVREKCAQNRAYIRETARSSLASPLFAPLRPPNVTLSLSGRSVLSFMLLNRIIPGTSVIEATRTRVINEGRAKFEEVES